MTETATVAKFSDPEEEFGFLTYCPMRVTNLDHQPHRERFQEKVLVIQPGPQGIVMDYYDWIMFRRQYFEPGNSPDGYARRKALRGVCLDCGLDPHGPGPGKKTEGKYGGFGPNHRCFLKRKLQAGVMGQDTLFCSSCGTFPYTSRREYLLHHGEFHKGEPVAPDPAQVAAQAGGAALDKVAGLLQQMIHMQALQMAGQQVDMAPLLAQLATATAPTAGGGMASAASAPMSVPADAVLLTDLSQVQAKADDIPKGPVFIRPGVVTQTDRYGEERRFGASHECGCPIGGAHTCAQMLEGNSDAMPNGIAFERPFVPDGDGSTGMKVTGGGQDEYTDPGYATTGGVSTGW